MAKGKISDQNVLSNSAKMAGNEMVGVKDSGYITKKGLSPESILKLPLPPGTDIEDQSCRDINPMPMKMVTSLGYPGDGWT